MKREEEIRQAAAAYILDMYGEINEDSDVAEGFREGAKWADETMIEKACRWLLEGGYFVNNTETIDDFRRAMEE